MVRRRRETTKPHRIAFYLLRAGGRFPTALWNRGNGRLPELRFLARGARSAVENRSCASRSGLLIWRQVLVFLGVKPAKRCDNAPHAGQAGSKNRPRAGDRSGQVGGNADYTSSSQGGGYSLSMTPGLGPQTRLKPLTKLPNFAGACAFYHLDRRGSGCGYKKLLVRDVTGIPVVPCRPRRICVCVLKIRAPGGQLADNQGLVRFKRPLPSEGTAKPVRLKQFDTGPNTIGSGREDQPSPSRMVAPVQQAPAPPRQR